MSALLQAPQSITAIPVPLIIEMPTIWRNDHCRMRQTALAEARGEVIYGASFVEWFAEECKRPTVTYSQPGQ